VNFDRTPFPVDSETISTYACFLSEEFKSSDSIRNYISGIKTWATLFKHNVDNFYSPSVKLTLTGLDKLNIRIPNQRLPLLVSHLFQLYECINQENLSDSVLWALILIAFFGMLRKSQFANSSKKSFTSAEQFTRGDFLFTIQGMIVNIKWSKTMQKHNIIHQVPLIRKSGSVLCPVTAYSHMLNLIPAKASDPAFGLPNSKGSIVPFSKLEIDRLLRDLFIKCQIPIEKFSFHSLRRGGATLAASAGCTDSEICSIGHWVSSCYRGYIAHFPATLFSVSDKMINFAHNSFS